MRYAEICYYTLEPLLLAESLCLVLYELYKISLFYNSITTDVRLPFLSYQHKIIECDVSSELQCRLFQVDSLSPNWCRLLELLVVHNIIPRGDEMERFDTSVVLLYILQSKMIWFKDFLILSLLDKYTSLFHFNYYQSMILAIKAYKSIVNILEEIIWGSIKFWLVEFST